MKYLIGNWKSNKTNAEAIDFFNTFASLMANKELPQNVKVVICPAFVNLPQTKWIIEKLKLPLTLGAQDISPFEAGAYTGEVNGSQLKELVEFVLIGHSERRTHFGEKDDLLKLKVLQAKKSEIKVVYCVSDDKTFIPKKVDFVAYEPVFAIGSGVADSPENAQRVIKNIKNKLDNIPVIYGGSVNADNINEFLELDAIDGVLPGKSSLDPNQFYQMLINATN